MFKNYYMTILKRYFRKQKLNYANVNVIMSTFTQLGNVLKKIDINSSN